MIDQITVPNLKHLWDTAAPRVIDVREQWEFDQGHLPGAELIPMASVPGRIDAFRSDDEPVYVVCRSGNRSGQVVTYLAQNGIHAVNVAGGTADWQAHNFPIDSTPAERTLTS